MCSDSFRVVLSRLHRLTFEIHWGEVRLHVLCSSSRCNNTKAQILKEFSHMTSGGNVNQISPLFPHAAHRITQPASKTLFSLGDPAEQTHIPPSCCKLSSYFICSTIWPSEKLPGLCTREQAGYRLFNFRCDWDSCALTCSSADQRNNWNPLNWLALDKSRQWHD